MEIQETNKLLSEVSSIIETFNTENKEKQKEKAIYFNSLTQFLSIGENKLSEILAFFLDPNETHGQGNVFLRLFLEGLNDWGKSLNINIDNVLDKEVYVKVERLTNKERRIDIYIEFGDNEFIIAIENKLDAKDQTSQLADYYEYIKSLTRNSILIYLTPIGKKANDYSLKNNTLNLENKDYIRINYHKQMIELTDKWVKIAEAEKIKNFLLDFKNYLNKQINKIDIMNELSNKISDSIVGDKKIEAAFEIAKAITPIKNNLFNKLKEILNSNGFDCDINFGIAHIEAVLSLNFNFKLAITFLEYRNFFVIGLSKEGENQEYKGELIHALEELKLGKNEPWAVWSWVTRTNEYSEWDNASSWLKVQNGEFENFIKRIVEKVNSVE